MPAIDEMIENSGILADQLDALREELEHTWHPDLQERIRTDIAEIVAFMQLYSPPPPAACT